MFISFADWAMTNIFFFGNLFLLGFVPYGEIWKDTIFVRLPDVI